MEVENKTEKEVVYAAADGGRPVHPKFRLRILFWLWAFFLRVRVALSTPSNLRHWCDGKSCWGMLPGKAAPYKLKATKTWKSCHMSVIVRDLPPPQPLQGKFSGPPTKVQIVYQNGSFKLCPIY